jgi:hypothetical protein
MKDLWELLQRSYNMQHLYLNDDFEGGELVFPQHNLTILPKSGMAASTEVTKSASS